MKDRPHALDLLRIANQTLLQEILPDAHPDHRYTLRMIINALGIAARELEAHDTDAAAETHGLNLLYGESTDSLQGRNRQFANDIRSGEFESGAPREAALRRHLLAIARAKLAAAYPKGLLAPKSPDSKNIA